MRTVFNLGPAVGTALVAAAFVAASGCGSLDRSVARNNCATSSECNPGHVCVAGICQAPMDAGADREVDAPTPDLMAGVDAGIESAPDLPAVGEAGADMPILQPPDDAGSDARDAPAANDADATDARSDDVLGPEPPRDAGIDLPRDPCVTGTGQESPAATSALLAALPSVWRQCPASVAADPDVSWLLGGTAVVQLGIRNWSHCSDGQTPSCGLAQGIYFRVLEGSNSVFHFAEQVDGSVAGADISIRYFPGSKLLQLSACDGAIRCSSSSTHLVYVGPVPGS